MYKISDFDFLKKITQFKYEKDIKFFSVAASEDRYPEKMLFYIIDLKYRNLIDSHKENVAGIICTEELKDELCQDYDLIISSDPKMLFFLIHNNMKASNRFNTIIEEGCNISPYSCISPFNVIIKSGTTIEEFVSIKENVEIGNNTFIGAGSVIGAEGFNVFKIDGQNFLVKHKGSVIIGNNVVILSNACIAKSIYGHIDTVVEDNVMIDNLVHIAHDSHICSNAELAAGAIICGFASVGENTFMGVNSSAKQLIVIGKNNKIGMGAAVNYSTEDNKIVAGYEPMYLEDARILKHYNRNIIGSSNNR